jgi:phosphate starvation-inducible PhoH-like protein
MAVSSKIAFEDNALVAQLVGPRGLHLKLLGNELGVQVHARGNEMTILGTEEQVAQARKLLTELYEMAGRGRTLDEGDLRRASRELAGQGHVDVKEIYEDRVLRTPSATVRAKSAAQKRYIDAIRRSDVVFGVGPAGTGKTYLAMAMAVSALVKNEVKRIILTRPAVEAGERLGFLPGDLVDKVNPYLRPLYDALHDMLDVDRTEQLMERGQIEVAPLAFMRGRTLNGSFVILDEAQNSTSEQMLMFLTRLGFDSQAVVTGDVTQVDLPNGQTSGLAQAVDLLKNIDGIDFCRFTEADVVRHPLVQKIIKAYELMREREGPTKAPEQSESL